MKYGVYFIWNDDDIDFLDSFDSMDKADAYRESQIKIEGWTLDSLDAKQYVIRIIL